MTKAKAAPEQKGKKKKKKKDDRLDEKAVVNPINPPPADGRPPGNHGDKPHQSV